MNLGFKESPLNVRKISKSLTKIYIIGGQRLDLLVESELVLELKAVDRLTGFHEAQIHSYMKATGHRIGLLINFYARLLKDDGIIRIVR